MKKIIIRQSSGLGNQMFIYGCGYVLAKKYGMDLYQDLSKYYLGITSSYYQLEEFNLSFKKKIRTPFKMLAGIKKLKKIHKKLIGICIRTFYHYIGEKQFIKYQNIEINIKRNNYLQGFWQNASYVSECREDLKKEFTLIDTRTEFKNKAAEISSGNVCGIHIRRGDYLSFFGGSLDISYYFEAMSKMREEDPTIVFLVFSDDLEFCKALFGKLAGVMFMEPGFSGIEEMQLMRHCKRLIIANSTFSWWGAFLSEATRVICPRVAMWTDEYYLEEWEKLDAKMVAASEKGLRNL